MPLVLTTAGLSIVAVVLGVVEHRAWYGKIDAFDGTPGCNPNLGDRGGTACTSLYNDGTRAKKLAFVAYGSAGALALTSAILYFVLDRPSSEQDQRVACSMVPLSAQFEQRPGCFG